MDPNIKKKTDKYKTEDLLSEKLQLHHDGNDSKTRVALHALDFNWALEDTNARDLMLHLAHNAKPKLLVQYQFRIYIQLMWDVY